MFTRKSWLSLLGASVAAIVFAIMVELIVAAHPSTTPLTAQQPRLATEQAVTQAPVPNCSGDWSQLAQAEHNQCVFQKATQMARQMAGLITPTAGPTLPPLPTPKGTALPSGYIPEKVKRIYMLDPEGAGVDVPVLVGVNSLWHIGGLVDSEGDGYSSLSLFAKPPTTSRHALLGTTTYGNFGRAEDAVYEQRWELPVDVGTITITNVLGPVTSPTGPIGLVTFATSLGQTGTFNMGTHEWVLNGVSLGTAVPNVTPSALPLAQPYPSPIITSTITTTNQ